jgi:hypothetical protein
MEETMKKIIFTVCLIFLTYFTINAQAAATPAPSSAGASTTTNTPGVDNITTANSQIVEVRLSGFEDASFWDVKMPIDQGVISRQTRPGAPKDVISDSSTFAKRDEKSGIPRNYSRDKVLGVKVEYISRGYNYFTIKPVKPIIIEGICQNIKVWVAGKNYKHTLKLLVQDFFGNDRQLLAGPLNFIGWKEMLVSIPENINQRDFHFVDKQGIKFNGFLVECEPMETYGVYYIYFDELRAETDIFNEKTRDVDDMHDDW